MADQDNAHGLLTLILSGVSIVAAAGTTIWVAISQRRQNRDTATTNALTAREQRIADEYDHHIDDLKTDVGRLRGERDEALAIIEHLRHEHDGAIGLLKLELAREQAAKLEALEGAANVRRMFDDKMMAHRIESKTQAATLEACQWKVKSARVWIVQVRETWYVTRAECRARGDFSIPDVPAAPQWIDSDDPPPASDES